MLRDWLLSFQPQNFISNPVRRQAAFHSVEEIIDGITANVSRSFQHPRKPSCPPVEITVIQETTGKGFFQGQASPNFAGNTGSKRVQPAAFHASVPLTEVLPAPRRFQLFFSE
ncbi:hypothetical protein QOT17_007466 [Balamuthia mandrillaris]